MDNIKDKNYYLNKVLENLYTIRSYISNITFEAFSHNEMLQSAVCFIFIQVYENAKNLRKEDFDSDFNKTIILLRGFRNLIVHEYGKIDFSSVYETATKNVPEFIKKLEKELK